MTFRLHVSPDARWGSGCSLTRRAFSLASHLVFSRCNPRLHILCSSIMTKSSDVKYTYRTLELPTSIRLLHLEL